MTEWLQLFKAKIISEWAKLAYEDKKEDDDEAGIWGSEPIDHQDDDDMIRVAPTRVSASSIVMWYPDGTLANLKNHVFPRCNPVFHMFVFFMNLGNWAFNNVLAIDNLNNSAQWTQRWFGQAGLLNLATNACWVGTEIRFVSTDASINHQ